MQTRTARGRLPEALLGFAFRFSLINKILNVAVSDSILQKTVSDSQTIAKPNL